MTLSRCGNGVASCGNLWQLFIKKFIKSCLTVATVAAPRRGVWQHFLQSKIGPFATVATVATLPFKFDEMLKKTVKTAYFVTSHLAIGEMMATVATVATGRMLKNGGYIERAINDQTNGGDLPQNERQTRRRNLDNTWRIR